MDPKVSTQSHPPSIHTYILSLLNSEFSISLTVTNNISLIHTHACTSSLLKPHSPTIKICLPLNACLGKRKSIPRKLLHLLFHPLLTLVVADTVATRRRGRTLLQDIYFLFILLVVATISPFFLPCESNVALVLITYSFVRSF